MHDKIFEKFENDCYGKESCRIYYDPSDWDNPECASKLDSGWFDAVYYASCELN